MPPASSDWKTIPRCSRFFTFAQNQILAEALNQHYVEKYAHPTDQEIQAYYDQNQKKYLEVTLQRIIVPMQQVTTEKPKPDQEAQKALAEKIRQRWVAGEDPTKLEKEAMDSSDVKTTPPDVNVGARRPGSLPEAHEARVRSEGGRNLAGLLRPRRALHLQSGLGSSGAAQRSEDADFADRAAPDVSAEKLEAIQKAVTPQLNDAYFGPETPATIPQTIIRPGVPPRPGAPVLSRRRPPDRCELHRRHLQRQTQDLHLSNHGRKSKCPGHRRFRKSGNQAASFSVGISRGGRRPAPTTRILPSSALSRWTWAARPAAWNSSSCCVRPALSRSCISPSSSIRNRPAFSTSSACGRSTSPARRA